MFYSVYLNSKKAAGSQHIKNISLEGKFLLIFFHTRKFVCSQSSVRSEGKADAINLTSSSGNTVFTNDAQTS